MTVDLTVVGLQTSTGDAGGDTLIDIENLFGSGNIDTLTGDGGDNILSGEGGADTLNGGGNTPFGDTASYMFSLAGVTVDLKILGPQVSTGDASGDILNGIENLFGSTNADVLAGNSGNNRLDGSFGSDTAQFAGAVGTYTIRRVDNVTTTWIVTDTATGVNGDDGSDTLSNIETLTFLTGATSLTVSQLIGALIDSNGTANSVAQGAATGTAVGITGFAPDGDIVNYSLTSNIGGHFQINGASGIVTVANGAFTAPTHGITIRATSADGSFTEKAFTVSIAGNVPPSAVTLANKKVAIAESASTAVHTKVADILVTDPDGGSNTLALTGANAGLFEIAGNALFLKAGVKLDFETNSSYAVQVTADDGTGGSPDATSSLYTLLVSNVSPETILGTAAANTLVGGSDKDLIFGLGGNDKLIGGGNNDRLTGAAGNDILTGGLGVDTLIGGFGRDIMTGNAQRDIFDFNLAGETGKTPFTRDVIKNFTHFQGDDIDLSTIDAKAGVIGNQAFSFIGQKAFSGVKGQLHYKFEGPAKTIVEGDIDGNKVADFQIELTGHRLLVLGDFIL